MDLLLTKNDNISRYVRIENFNRFMYDKSKNKVKNGFCRYFCYRFKKYEVITTHAKICLEINRKQCVKSRKDEIDFANCNRKITSLFKVYAEFESILEEI